MDFEYIKTLLYVVHNSIGVPNTGNISKAAQDELAVINAGDSAPAEEPAKKEEKPKPAERKI